MSVRAVKSWSLHCDDCDVQFENCEGWTLFDGDEDWLLADARDSDWLIRDGLHLCPMCWEKKPFCRDEDDKCLRRDVTEADDDWLYCPDHIGQGMDS